MCVRDKALPAIRGGRERERGGGRERESGREREGGREREREREREIIDSASGLKTSLYEPFLVNVITVAVFLFMCACVCVCCFLILFLFHYFRSIVTASKYMLV